MSIAETSVLAVELKLNGVTAYTSGMAQAEAATGRLNTATSGFTGATTKAVGGLAKLGGAFSHAGSQLKGLITGPLGLIGLTGGLFSLGGIFESSIRHASDMGFAVEKLTGLTGESATEMSRLLVTFEKFGITADKTAQIVGFTEKTLGNLAVNGTLQQKIMENYGLSIRDASGHLKDFGTILGNVADYYNSNTSEANKAALAAQLFGRGYAQMIPILKLGSAGIKEAEEAAASLGLTLTDQNAKELKDYRGAIRDVGEAIGGLQLQIGLALIPEVQKLAVGLTHFLENGGAKQIVQFFKDGAKFAEDMGHVIETQVVPVFQNIVGAWNKIPAGLKNFLVTAFVANKTSKFLFDFGIGDLTKAAGGIFSRGGNPAMPLFVKEVAGLGGATAGLGGISASSLAAGIGIALVPIIAAEFVLMNNRNPYTSPTSPTPHGLPPGNATSNAANAGQQRWVMGPDGRWVVVDANGNIVRQNSGGQTVGGPAGQKIIGALTAPGVATDPEAIARLRQAAASWDTQSEKTGIRFAIAAQKLAEAGGLMAKEFLDRIGGTSGVRGRSQLKFKKDPSDAAVDNTFQRDLLHAAGMINRSSESNDRKLADLKVLEKSGNGATKTAIEKIATAIRKQKPPSVTVNVLTAVNVSAGDITIEQKYRRRYGPVVQV